ncbi:MAG: ketopantoate reductase family protein [Acidobacteriota bacterium]
MLHCLLMRYIVYGAGAIGSALGGLLANLGRPVVLVTRTAHAHAIAKSGLIIHTKEKRLQVKVMAIESLAEITCTTDDIILLTNKTQDTMSAITQLASWARPDTPIVCLQNGVRNESMAATRFSQVIGGLVNFNANFLAPGVVERTMWNLIALGCYPEGINPLVEAIANDFREVGFDTHCYPQIMRAKWGKLIANLNNATNAITNTYLQQALSNPSHKEFMAQVMAEGIMVLDRAGIPLDDGGLYDIRARLAAVYNQPAQPADDSSEIDPLDRSYPSTWQDLTLGRKQLEVRFFNGEIVALGVSLGLNTPYNSVLLEVVENMAVKGEKPGRYRLAELKELVAARARKVNE